MLTIRLSRFINFANKSLHSHTCLTVFCLSLFINSAWALGNAELLPADQAFKLSAKVIAPDTLQIDWDIHEDYYLYQNKLAFKSLTETVHLQPPSLPKGKVKHDDYFGDVVTYRKHLTVTLPFKSDSATNTLRLQVKYQGCADMGVCYPPQKKILTLNIGNQTTPSNNPVKQLFQGFGQFTSKLFEDELLPADEAFRLLVSVKNPQLLHFNWELAKGYYLYRDKIHISLENNDGVQLGSFTVPKGEPYHDESFGQVRIFHHKLAFDVPLIRQNTSATTIKLLVKYQGCADRGVCYPPMQKTLSLALPAAQAISPATPAPQSEQDMIVSSLQNDSFWITLFSFAGFGLLLAFTPCTFPMIPILSGIIVGQGKNIGSRKAFLLSFCYVLASALMYTLFGVLAALFGSNLQVTFQQPWIIVLFSLIFILLALSMFGFFHLQMPRAIQLKLNQHSDKNRDGSYLGAGIMGALSSLIVGPCVAAPLAAALIYIGQSGDVVLGASSLFFMGFAMGIPLLILGTSAGKLLPKAGHWMSSINAVFGVIMLAVAVWMLDRILPAQVTMFLWALLLIIPAIYLNAIDPLPEESSNWHKLWKGVGVVFLVYGVLLLIGLSTGNTNPLRPLHGIATAEARTSQQQELAFEKIHSVEELNQKIQQAAEQGKWLMLDFYADWCISCKEMESFTFTDPGVRQRLSNFILVQADVTANNDQDKALLKRFNLIGPPGIIFFGPDKQERVGSRVIGYQDAETFMQTLRNLL